MNLSVIILKIFNTLRYYNRMTQFRLILKSAMKEGYSFYTMQEFNNCIKTDISKLKTPLIILRHDIDTDAKSAELFSKEESGLGIKATYFFRLRTWNINVIRKILSSGHEVGYHNEEVADYAKQNHIKSRDLVICELKNIQELFKQRILMLRRIYNIDVRAVASHGDFVNRKLGLKNNIVLSNEAFRNSLGIDYEAYDETLVKTYQNHVSDKPHPEMFKPNHPMFYIKNKQSFLLLTHPRWWKTNYVSTIKESILRFWEQIVW